VLCDGWLYVSGQGPLDVRTGQVIRGTIEEETRTTLEHVGKILQAGGTAPCIVTSHKERLN
jgi:2-iminobutanoate/2-iminopropanoate deaminase